MLYLIIIISSCNSSFPILGLLFHCKFVKGSSELSNDLFVSGWMELDTTTRISLNFKWVDNRKWKSVSMELLSKACTTIQVLTILSFLGHAVWASFFDINDHICGVKLIDVEVEEFVDKLRHRLSILLFWHVKLLNNFQILLKKGICFIHTIHFFVDVLRRVIVSSSFWI